MTRSSSRMEAASSPFASAGFEGTPVLLPGSWVTTEYGHPKGEHAAHVPKAGVVHAGMLTCRAHTCADHRADDQRTACLAAEHIAQLGALVEDLIEADAEEVDKHQFCYWTQTGGSRADCRSNVACLGNGGVEHTIAPEFLYQSLGDAKDTTPCIFTLKVDDTSPTCDILTHQNNTRIAAHLQPHCFVDRLSIGQLTNCNSHDVPPSVS